jgi:hypothetical protein
MRPSLPSPRTCGILALVVSWALGTSAALAFDPDAEFAKGTKIISLQFAGGTPNDVEKHREAAGLNWVTIEPRFSYLPFEPFGAGWYRSAFEPGLEGFYQRYFGTESAYAMGVKLALRYHLIGLGPLVPYFEGNAAAAGTTLGLEELHSAFVFVLEAGAGFSYFVAPRVAVNLGYRFQHISNGGTSSPNRGLNSNSGVLGVSYHFR